MPEVGVTNSAPFSRDPEGIAGSALPSGSRLNGNRWMHRWAVLTAVVTLPLLFLGAEVTTRQVGMVDRDWPTAPWLLWFKSWSESGGLGFLIEHGHRLAGYTVGTCAMVLCAGLWLTEKRRWLCWMGTAVLLGVIVQGVLGGMRVLLDQWLGPNLAVIHGCFGQMVFALIVSVALCTSRRWAEPVESVPAEETAGLRHWSQIVIVLLVLQLILGATFRHRGFSAAVRGHMVVAFAVVASVTWLLKLAHEYPADARIKAAARMLAGVIAIQVLLGVEAFFVRQSVPMLDGTEHWLWRRDLIRSAHVLVGSLALATSVVVTLATQRRTAWATGVSSAAATHLEGAA